MRSSETLEERAQAARDLAAGTADESEAEDLRNLSLVYQQVLNRRRSGSDPRPFAADPAVETRTAD